MTATPGDEPGETHDCGGAEEQDADAFLEHGRDNELDDVRGP